MENVNQAAPAETFETMLAAAAVHAAPINGPNGQQYVKIPANFKLEELKNEAKLPVFIKQSIILDDRASLSGYANRFKDHRSIIIADFDTLTITANLDWHHPNDAATPNASASVSHAATLKLRPSEEFSRWDSFVKAGFHDQETFARFLEENSCDVLKPDPASLIEISRDFEATVGQTYKSSTRLQNGDRKIIFDSESRATNDVVVPSQITLKMPFYNGEEASEIVAKFRWRPASGAVVFALEWHRVDYHRRAHFNEIAEAVAKETQLPLFVGRPA